MKTFDIILIVVTLAFGLITKFFPDFPMNEEIFVGFVIWILAKLGINSNRVKKAENSINKNYWKYGK